MSLLSPTLLFLLSTGCGDGLVQLGGETSDDSELTIDADADGDGIPADEDCDDEDPEVYPGAEEGDEADGIDQDCNGVADDKSVCQDGLADYDDLEEAVNDAPDGFTLMVCAGTYSVSLRIDDKELGIVAIEGPALTTLQGDGEQVVRVDGRGELYLEGFTITGGQAEQGAGVSCDGAELTMVGNEVVGNQGGDGAGLYTEDCDVDIQGNVFADNEGSAWGGGGGFYNSEGEVRGNLFQANIALEGGGFAISGGEIQAIENEVRGNLATTTDEEYRGAGSGGGGVWIDGKAELRGNVIADNTSAYNGGGLISFQGTGDLEGNTISGNVSQEDGGGLYFNYASSRVEGNTISNNEAWDDAGGLRSYVGRLVIVDNLFEENSAGDDGGGLKMSHSSNTVRDSTFIGNRAGDAGGGLELDNETADVSGCFFQGNEAYRGAGIHSWTNEGRFTISDSVFLENTAQDCGGALSFDNAPYRVTLENLELTDNYAGDGAAICLDYVLIDPGEETERYYASDVRLVNSYVSDNDAGDDGGIAYVKAGQLLLLNVTTHDNDSPESGGFSVKAEGTLSVSNSIISGVDGNVVYLEDDGQAEFSYTAFWDSEGFVGMESPLGADGNARLEPDFQDADGLDFELGSQSECIDAGDPDIRDTDGSRSDMGASGGPGAQ
ncbi:MAG: hypothetical protein ACI9VR_002774 [Cognaticolwellia sp.]|jgi:hypothetical protein